MPTFTAKPPQSHGLRVYGSSAHPSEPTTRKRRRVMGPQTIESARALDDERHYQKMLAMSEKSKRELEKVAERSSAYNEWEDVDFEPDEEVSMLEAVLSGEIEAPTSSAGGELHEELTQEIRQIKQSTSRHDRRSRKERVERRTGGFACQRDKMVIAYMDWSLDVEAGLDHGIPGTRCGDGETQGTMRISVLDTYGVKTVDVVFQAGDANIAATLVRQGIIPTAPFDISFGVSTRLLELFRCLQLRCPRLGTEPFLKALSDMQSEIHRSYRAEQFAIANNLYLELREMVRKNVDEALGRQDPTWRMKNACPACTYTLQGEEDLIFKILVTMDGNNSLKRVLSKARRAEGGEGLRNERTDTRTIGEDYYLSREKVDRWAKGVAQDLISKAIGEVNTCDSRWKNMANDITSKMWAIFDETGIFLALCRHGFVLVILDMVRSGELAKYGLAVVDSLLDAYGSCIGGGYDIGCKFGTTVAKSDLGPKAKQLTFRSLVGAFHGHAHSRKCQLSNLTTYVPGLGLEDLEGCERFFSRSNALAPSTRYASAFHRKQRIVTYLRHTDNFETYANLSKFLVNNYKQALNILAMENTFTLTAHGQGIINTSVFESWLEEERQYLQGLSTEPLTETREMEYLKQLQNLYYWDSIIRSAHANWLITTPSTMNQQIQHQWAQQERSVRHALEMQERTLVAVQKSENQLEVAQRWVPNSLDWNRVAEMVELRDYQRAIDNLESLVVSRIFELTKMNLSETGYKLRTQIAKALQARSQAIKTAIDKYNTTAHKLKPPRDTISWDDVVEYTFLSEFDLLRDTRQDVKRKPWATAASRKLLDQYFKIKRAQEERQRLNIEIRRVVTYIRDETHFLQAKEEELKKTNPALACQVALRRHERGRFNHVHLRRFNELRKLSGFTGVLEPGVREGTNGIEIETVRGSVPDAGQADPSPAPSPNPEPEADDDDAAGDDEDSTCSEGIAYQMLLVADDGV